MSDHADASPEAVAEYCGVELDRVPADRVPLAEYRETGTVVCDDCGEEPDPPRRAIAVFGGEVLCHECAAASLDAEDLSDLEATALVLHHFGWSAADIAEEPTIEASDEDADDLLRQAQVKFG